MREKNKSLPIELDKSKSLIQLMDEVELLLFSWSQISWRPCTTQGLISIAIRNGIWNGNIKIQSLDAYVLARLDLVNFVEGNMCVIDKLQERLSLLEIGHPSDLLEHLKTDLLDGILRDREYGRILENLFRVFQVKEGRLTVDPQHLKDSVSLRAPMRWVAKLSLITKSKDSYRIHPYFEEVVKEYFVIGKKMSPKELQLQLDRQKERGLAAEEFILKIEKTRLKNCGLDTLADLVRHVATFDCSRGYDILSYEEDGTKKFIEVKSSSGPPLEFFLSENERMVAKRSGSQYLIAWVPFTFNNAMIEENIIWIRDIENQIFANSSWNVDTDSYRIRRRDI